jgi:ABC-2 type transport system ATP-binding protein
MWQRAGRRTLIGMTTLAPLSPSPPDPLRLVSEFAEQTGDSVLEVDDLVKRYRSAEVLRGVTFRVHRGELFGLLGTNGAGKTTTIEIVQGLRRATSGRVRVLGLDPATAGDDVRRRIGSQLQDAALPDRLRVGEALRLMASLHPSPRPLDELAAEWRLEGLWKRPFGALSGGERQRLFVALALVGRPELVFLDELTQNLDPVSRRHTWDVVRQIRDQGTTVVLVTHDVEEAEKLCDRLVVLHAGRVVAEGTPAGIVDALGGRTTVRFADAELDIRPLRAIPGAERVHRRGPEVHVEGRGPLLAHVGAHLVALDRPALDLRSERPTLEDRFVTLTQEHSS